MAVSCSLKVRHSHDDMPQGLAEFSSLVRSLVAAREGLCRIKRASPITWISGHCCCLYMTILGLSPVVGLISSACLCSTRVSRGIHSGTCKSRPGPRHDQTYCCQEGVGRHPTCPLIIRGSNNLSTLSVPSSSSFLHLDILV